MINRTVALKFAMEFSTCHGNLGRFPSKISLWLDALCGMKSTPRVVQSVPKDINFTNQSHHLPLNIRQWTVVNRGRIPDWIHTVLVCKIPDDGMTVNVRTGFGSVTSQSIWAHHQLGLDLLWSLHTSNQFCEVRKQCYYTARSVISPESWGI